MIHEFDPILYPNKVWITYDLKDKEIKNHFIRQNGEEIDSYYSNTHAVCILVIQKETNEAGVLIKFSNKKEINFNTVAHEASHTAKHIFEFIGANVTEHEPFEYLVGWIAGCCETVKKYKQK